MKSILTIFAASAFLLGIMAAASAADVIELSTLGKKSQVDAISLPQLSPTMPTIAPAALGSDITSNVMDLSTLGKKAVSTVPTTALMGATPITITPMFAVRNTNTSNVAGSTVFTLPQAVSSGNSVYTPPIAIFGGA